MMKFGKIAMTWTLLTAGLVSHGQNLSFSGDYSSKKVPDDLKKGNRILSIDGLAGASRSMQRKNLSWSIAPSIGYLLINRLPLGVRLSYGQNVAKLDGTSGTIKSQARIHGLAPEIFARYYLTSYRVKPFLQLSSGYNVQWGRALTSDFKNVDVSTGTFTANGAAGLSFLLSKNLSLELLYNQRLLGSTDWVDPNKQTKIRFGLSFFLF